MMKYKGYIGKVEYYPDEKIFYGKVEGLNAILTFQGTTVEEIDQAFKDTIEDYLQWCKERGKEPEKTYSGNLRIRLEPNLHASLSKKASMHGVSLNSFIVEQLKKCA